MLKALSPVYGPMISSNSKYDKFRRNEVGGTFRLKKRQVMLFQSKCATCHATDLTTDHSF
jgi:cytochrome c peroxidase